MKKLLLTVIQIALLFIFARLINWVTALLHINIPGSIIVKSFTKASQSLYVSQPTISKMIKNLEEELGIELFYRNGRQVELTDAGHSMYVQALISSAEKHKGIGKPS